MLSTIDFRSMNPRFQSGLFFSLFEGLLPGHSLRILMDHEPKGIFEGIQATQLKNYTWTYEEFGPDLWVILLQKHP